MDDEFDRKFKEFTDSRKVRFMDEIVDTVKRGLPEELQTFPDFEQVASRMFKKILEQKTEAFKALAIETTMELVDDVRVKMMNNGTLDVLVDGEGNISLARIEKDEG